jgi:hypothetical protein
MPDDNNENDLLADLLDEEIEAGEGDPKPAANEEDLKALKTQVDELTTANAGLLKAKQAAVRKRQDGDERLAKMEGAINGILSQRQQQGIESVTVSEAAAAQSKGIPVTYDDDGNGWINPDYIQKMVSPYEQKILDLEAKLQQTDSTMSATANAEKVMSGIIGEDERFGPASGRYRAARKWVEDQVFDFSKTNGVNRVLSSGEALDHVFNDSYIQGEFKKQFEGIDLVDVVTAEDSQSHFRRTLDNIAGAMNTEDDQILKPKDKMDSRFQKVLDKPSSLGNQPNAKAGQLSVLEKVGQLKTSDIMELTDDQVEALMKLSEREG